MKKQANPHAPKPEDCWLGKDDWPDQCCCACKHHVADHYEHTSENHERKRCFRARDTFICLAPEMGATSGFATHSVGCELYEQLSNEALRVKWQAWRERLPETPDA